MSETIRVTVWGENVHERQNERVRAVYPDGMHTVIAGSLQAALTPGSVRTATMDQSEHGLTEEVLNETDVLTWWGHMVQDEVDDRVVERVQRRVLEGMGLVVLHSAHYSKIFKRLMGTGCGLRWREADELERIWVINPSHPIATGLPAYFEIEAEEMYGEIFDVPEPDELIFLSWFEGGEVFRSGCTWRRGQGKIFFFRPGHETYPTYYDPNVQRVIANGVKWASPSGTAILRPGCPQIKVSPSPIRGRGSAPEKPALPGH